MLYFVTLKCEVKKRDTPHAAVLCDTEVCSEKKRHRMLYFVTLNFSLKTGSGLFFCAALVGFRDSSHEHFTSGTSRARAGAARRTVSPARAALPLHVVTTPSSSTLSPMPPFAVARMLYLRGGPKPPFGRGAARVCACAPTLPPPCAAGAEGLGPIAGGGSA